MQEEFTELLRLDIYDVHLSIHCASKIIGPLLHNTFLIYGGCHAKPREVSYWIHRPVYRSSMHTSETYSCFGDNNACAYVISSDPAWISYGCPSEMLKVHGNMKDLELAETLDEQPTQTSHERHSLNSRKCKNRGG